ncbi:NmrA family protein [Ramaria rubella]|nr:NmrA family protein [Ramaria rubella]
MTTSRKVVLTGTTGKLGSSVLKHLLNHLPASSIIVSVYNPSKAPDYHGLEVRQGDYEDPRSLDKAFEGADVLFLVSYPSIRYQVRVKAHVNAIEAAKRSGTIKHIVYTSLAFAGGPENSNSVAAVMRAHLDTEAHLKSALPSDMTYTIIREGLYAESFPLYLGSYDLATKPSEVNIPPGDEDGLIAFTKRDELGEATAKILSSLIYSPPGTHNESGDFLNKTLLLAGEAKQSLTSLGGLVGKSLGRTGPVKVTRVSVDQYAAPGSRAAKFIGSPDMARDWASTYQAIGLGETNYQGEGSRELERLLGRKPEDVEETIGAMLKGQ